MYKKFIIVLLLALLFITGCNNRKQDEEIIIHKIDFVLEYNTTDDLEIEIDNLKSIDSLSIDSESIESYTISENKLIIDNENINNLQYGKHNLIINIKQTEYSISIIVIDSRKPTLSSPSEIKYNNEDINIIITNYNYKIENVKINDELNSNIIVSENMITIKAETIEEINEENIVVEIIMNSNNLISEDDEVILTCSVTKIIYGDIVWN